MLALAKCTAGCSDQSLPTKHPVHFDCPNNSTEHVLALATYTASFLSGMNCTAGCSDQSLSTKHPASTKESTLHTGLPTCVSSMSCFPEMQKASPSI